MSFTGCDHRPPPNPLPSPQAHSFPRLSGIVGLSVVRLLRYYVHVTKCLPDTTHKQSPKKTVLSKVLRFKGTSYDSVVMSKQSGLNLVEQLYRTGMNEL